MPYQRPARPEKSFPPPHPTLEGGRARSFSQGLASPPGSGDPKHFVGSREPSPPASCPLSFSPSSSPPSPHGTTGGDTTHHSIHARFHRCVPSRRDFWGLRCCRYGPLRRGAGGDVRGWGGGWQGNSISRNPLAKPPLLQGVLCILCSCVYGSKMYNIRLLFVADNDFIFITCTPWFSPSSPRLGRTPGDGGVGL